MRHAALLALLLLVPVVGQAQNPFRPVDGAGERSDPDDEGSGEGPGAEDPGTGVILDPENPGTGAIFDPENPGTGAIVDPENPGTGAIFDSENPATGMISDPENPGSGAIFDPQNPGSGTISDPENPGSPSPASAHAPARPSPSLGAPVAIFSGNFHSSASVDTRRDDAFEDTLELFQELEMRVRYRINDRWRAITEGRIGWLVTGAGDPGDPAWLPDADRVQGRVTPELRDFYVSGRAGRWLMRFGNQSIAWGSTDISKPADVINPVDLRRGLSAEREDIRVPVPAIDLVHAWNQVSWEFVLVPFFFPHRVSVYGADTAPIRPSGLTLGLVPGVGDLTLIDPSLEDLAQPLLLQTALPEETPRNMSAGSRVTLIRGGWDVSLGYFYGWDRTPRARFHPAAVALVEGLIEEGPGLFADNPIETPEVQAALAAVANGDRLFSAEYERMHTLEFDGVTYAGPLGIRFETAFNPRRTAYTADLRAVRRRSISSALGLSYESAEGDVVVSGELFHVKFVSEAGDGDYLLDMDDLLGLAAGLQLDFSAFAGAQGRTWERFAVQLASIYLTDGRDLVAAPSLSYDATERLELSVGATIFASLGDGQSLGDTLERNDSVFVRLSRAF